jgi:hypothetical protein
MSYPFSTHHNGGHLNQFHQVVSVPLCPGSYDDRRAQQTLHMGSVTPHHISLSLSSDHVSPSA